MIIELDKHSKYLDELENMFTDVFTKEKVLFDINNNTFTRYYAYVIDSKVIAFINYYLIYERAELININVKEDYQNKKIGTKLIEQMINDCRQNNVSSITLEVKKSNNNAIHLYEKMGFTKVSIRKGYYQGIDGILMEKELN